MEVVDQTDVISDGSNSVAQREDVERRKLRRSNQMRVVIPLVVVWALGSIVLLTTLRAGAIDNAQLLLDPSSLANLPWYTGLISNIGILAWTVAAVSAAAGARIAELAGRAAGAKFLRQAALFGGLLTLDDLFLLHSSVFPQALGTSKRIVLFAYAVAGIAWAVGNLNEIKRTRWGLLVAAGLAVGFSVLVDQLSGSGDQAALVVEDSAKFLGVITWATYFALTSRDIAESVIRTNR